MASKTGSVAKTARWMLVCATCVGGYEGLWLTAKPDTLAHGIPTVCYGETEGVKLGDHYTKEQCTEMLANKLPRYWSEIERCIKVETSDHEKIAYTSFAYNVGSAGFCRSSTSHKLNAGDHKGACDALMQWTRAGGKYVQGLANRRAKERTICLTPDAPILVAKVAPETPKLSAEVPAPAPLPKLAPLKPSELPKHLVCRGFLFWRTCK